MFHMNTWSHLFISFSPRNLQSHYLISVRDIHIYLPIHPSKFREIFIQYYRFLISTQHSILFYFSNDGRIRSLISSLISVFQGGNEIVTVACIFISLCSAWILAFEDPIESRELPEIMSCKRYPIGHFSWCVKFHVRPESHVPLSLFLPTLLAMQAWNRLRLEKRTWKICLKYSSCRVDKGTWFG